MVNLASGRGASELEALITDITDLAGQPGYRLIHQLHLSDLCVALIVFDSRSEHDPFAGVSHWSRVLRQAQRAAARDEVSPVKFLVAARVDRGGIAVSRERMEALVQSLDCAGYFETSALEGVGIDELRRAIVDSIPWTRLPHVVSTSLFQAIYAFLLREKEEGRCLSRATDLMKQFMDTRLEELPYLERHIRLEAGDLRRTGKELMLQTIGSARPKELRQLFETCIGRIQSQGLISVLLGDASREPQLPVFLRTNRWVDFRSDREKALDELIWGLTGVRTAR
jgi:hypothetical protein